MAVPLASPCEPASEADASLESTETGLVSRHAEPNVACFQLSFSKIAPKSTANVPAQAANATTINPGITRKAKERPPVMPARSSLLIVFVESPAKIGNTASAALIFPVATSEATEIAEECVSTKPATAAATTMPVCSG